ncbi:MAG: TIGR03621 family F420-dependent LLM class oxidoreductase [Chloroflexi bacterium]|nr:TIGR03621 family F420-dependent LLM class oxidoreductase [Chloroflexota bacterium]
MSKYRPFRFGVNVPPFGSISGAEWKARAQKAEALGYATFLVPDHLFGTVAPLSALGAAAAVTTTIRLGTLVLGNDFRHPVMLAREAATIDVLSDGRLELGLGTGWLRPDYTQPGIPFDPPGVRVSRLEEAVHVVKGAFAAEPFSFSGTYYTIDDLAAQPKPLQPPHPPILIGGGSKRILSFAAREADIVSINIKTTPEGWTEPGSDRADATRQKVDWVRAAAGDRFPGLELNILITSLKVTDNRRRAAAEIVDHWRLPGRRPTVDELLALPTTLIGTVDQIVDQLQEQRERYGLSYIIVWEPMEEFAPIVERLAGR